MYRKAYYAFSLFFVPGFHTVWRENKRYTVLWFVPSWTDTFGLCTTDDRSKLGRCSASNLSVRAPAVSRRSPQKLETSGLVFRCISVFSRNFGISRFFPSGKYQNFGKILKKK